MSSALTISLALGIVVLVACTDASSQKALVKSANGPKIPVGTAATIGSLDVTVEQVRVTDGRDGLVKDPEIRFPEAPEGKLYLLVDVMIENVGDGREDLSTRQQFNLFDENHDTQKWALLPISIGAIDGRIRPGRERRGVLVWEVREDATQLTMVFGDTLFAIGDAGSYRPGSSDEKKSATRQ